ncbi:nuclear transport factor 2 family protein [Hymenobacter sp. GOD-10R]|uniref:nuclear transport factor 2 family protein n=1 Tax=Hymenobacter sp. GOD-10R TaxID=3093922 RepID=UPI002D796F62|nr:nuclear transport factor 2 family protein [Hymenobacter sp. GOD-10R]WRQ31851.1 nuclear transport factor 2 family protein [Hymenobacter sp. GOD-10R]
MAPPSSDTHRLVSTYLQALTTRDIPALMTCFADRVDWGVPGARDLASWLGPRQQRAEIQQFFELLFAHTAPVDAQLEHLLVAGPVAIVTGTFASTLRQTGRLFTSPFFLLLTVAQGKIVRYRLLEDTHALVVALT